MASLNNRFRLAVGKYKFQKEIKGFHRDRKVMSMKDAKRIGLLYNATEPEDFEIVKTYVKKLLADKKEVTKLHDDSIQQFIDSIPTFERSRMTKSKNNNIRLEMLRAMTIIKFLYDHGIEAYRLKGTSMCYSSKSKEEEKENMICTLSVTKIIRAPSLYEYHFGKPKEPTKPKY